MLTVLRRGPTSFANPLRCSSVAATCSRSLRTHQSALLTSSNAASRPHLRKFSIYTPWRQQSAEAAAVREVEAELEHTDDGHAQKPASTTRVGGTADFGPVTQFKDLGDRNLVSKTVVDTLTGDMGLETMTPVQSMTIDESIKGVDMYAYH